MFVCLTQHREDYATRNQEHMSYDYPGVPDASITLRFTCAIEINGGAIFQ